MQKHSPESPAPGKDTAGDEEIKARIHEILDELVATKMAHEIVLRDLVGMSLLEMAAHHPKRILQIAQLKRAQLVDALPGPKHELVIRRAASILHDVYDDTGKNLSELLTLQTAKRSGRS